jgi:hypothetical protein
MKLKGVSVFEQYVEKAVLAAVSVVLLAVVAMQVLVEPNRVTVGRNSPVPPGRAYTVVSQKADQVKAQIDQVSPDKPAVQIEDLAAKFRSRFEEPLLRGGVRVALGEPIRVEGAALAPSQGNNSELPIAPIVVPAPTGVLAGAQWATFSPGEAAHNPDLMKLLPPSQPFDKASVSVEAIFDGTALRRSLLSVPEGSGSGVRAVPSQWWADAEIFAVRLEREERAETGEWTNVIEVPSLPGRQDIAAEASKEALSSADLLGWVGVARQSADEIRRPPFYEVLAGPAWVSPSEAAKLGIAGRPAEVEREFRARDGKIAERDRAAEALEKRRGAGSGPRRPPGGGGDGEMVPVPGGKGGGAQPPPGGKNVPPTKEDPQIVALERRVKSLDDEIKKVEERIVALGFDPQTGGALGIGGASATTRERPLLENDRVQVWAHDLTAVPGKTYRYRVRVVINNPAFGRGASMVAAQQDLAKRAMIDGTPSDWSAPITVPPETTYFVTACSEGGELGGSPRATVEVYRMFYGFYRRGATGLEPGDAIATEVKLPEKIKFPIWDMEKLKGGPEAPGGLQLPTGVPPPPSPGGRGAGSPEQIFVPSGGGQPGSPAGAPDAGKLPAGSVAWDKPIVVSLDSVLLDVARSPLAVETALGGVRTRFQSYFRGGDGRIVVRTPDDERSSPLYQRVAQSAKDGESQGEPVTLESEKKPNTPNRPGTPKPKADPGGGGGG